MEVLPWGQIGVGAGWSLVGLCVWLIFTGRLVPRSTLDRIEHDRNEWRTESRIKDAQLAEQAVQLRHLDEVGRTVEHAMSALQQAAQIPHPDDKRAS